MLVLHYKYILFNNVCESLIGAPMNSQFYTENKLQSYNYNSLVVIAMQRL